MLTNSEALYNVSKAELDLLETTGEDFLRKVLKAPKGNPKEILYLELGYVPFRELIRKRRILFLHHILIGKEESMTFKFLKSQVRYKKPKDWISQVLQHIEELGLNLKLDEIKSMKNSFLKYIVNKAVLEKTFEILNKKKEGHSKVMNLK